MGTEMKTWLVGLLVGLALDAMAMFFVVGAAGAGHGTYVPAAICFPFAMAISALMGTIHPALVAVAVVQFPFYGVLIGLAANLTRRVTLLACIHAGSVFIALLLMMVRGTFW
jgi:hypothetical protein